MRYLDVLVRRAERRVPTAAVSGCFSGRMYRYFWFLVPPWSPLFISIIQTVGIEPGDRLGTRASHGVHIVLQGIYFDILPLAKGDGSAYRSGDPVWWHRRNRGDIVFIHADQPRAMSLPGGDKPQACWSLLFAWPRIWKSNFAQRAGALRS